MTDQPDLPEPPADAGFFRLHCTLAKRSGRPVPTYDEWVAAGRPR